MTKLYTLLAVGVLSVSAFAQTTILSENFASLITGNNTTTTGSATPWTGNTNFPTVTGAFQAGGAVRLGTSPLSGSMTSAPLDLSVDGGNFKVELDVKGWTTVEGALIVSITGLASQTYSYDAVMAGNFEHITLYFTGGTSNSKVIIATTTRRAFIDNVVITSIPAVLAVGNSNLNRTVLVKNTSVDNALIFGAKANVSIFNANGQTVKSASVENGTSLDMSNLGKGFYIVTGIVDGQKVSQKIIKK